jgi:hypothetical protein
MITQATPAYFMTTFVTTFWNIFLEYSWKTLQNNLLIFLKNHTILLRFMLKI